MKHTASLTPMQPPACSATMGQLEGFLRSSVSSLPEEASCGARGPGRPCELSARCLWAAFLVCLLRGLRSQKAVCRACPVRSSCTRSPDGRSLTLAREPVQQALEQRRREQVTPAFQKQYALRAGVEATISQGVRTKGLRQARYRGQDKVHLHHLQIAAAINLTRIESWLRAQQQGAPARRKRPLSRFARLQKQEAS